ncbi:MAG: hypothetical protein ACXVBG_22115 [Isosphaeraceae bacterium]
MGDDELRLGRDVGTADRLRDVEHIERPLLPVHQQRWRSVQHRADLQAELPDQLDDHRQPRHHLDAGQGDHPVPLRSRPRLPFGQQAGRTQQRQASGLRVGRGGRHLLACDRLQLDGQVLVHVGLEQANQRASRFTGLGNAKPVVESRDDPSGHLLHAAGTIPQRAQGAPALDHVAQGEPAEVKHEKKP